MDTEILDEAPEVRRSAKGVSVNICTPECTISRTASGANLAYLLKRLGPNVDLLLITTFRVEDRSVEPPRPVLFSENATSFDTLPKTIRKELGTQSVGAYWLVGHWTTCMAPGDTRQDSLEYAWLLTRGDDDTTQEQWCAAALATAKRFHQQAYILRVGGEASVRRGDGSVDRRLISKNGIEEAWANLAELRSRPGTSGCTELRKEQEHGQPQASVSEFEGADLGSGIAKSDSAGAGTTSSYNLRSDGKPFAPDFFLVHPNANSGRMLFALEGISHHLPSDYRLRVVATRENIPTDRIDFLNNYNPRRIRRQAKAIKNGRKVERLLLAACASGDKYKVLDKRLLAAAAFEANLETIPAYVVRWAELQLLLDRYFDGELPEDLADLDEFIYVDDRPYDERTANYN